MLNCDDTLSKSGSRCYFPHSKCETWRVLLFAALGRWHAFEVEKVTSRSELRLSLPLVNDLLCILSVNLDSVLSLIIARD